MSQGRDKMVALQEASQNSRIDAVATAEHARIQRVYNATQTAESAGRGEGEVCNHATRNSARIAGRFQSRTFSRQYLARSLARMGGDAQFPDTA
ncbi:MAG: hypothetical protein KGQ41_08395, partial [Alphaproteobacteria bacterium]|nr:hypothetical protein [Alphaproteobacteria bacterium]